MEQDIKQFIQSIQGMDNEEIAYLILYATSARNMTFEKLGINYLDPIIELEKNPYEVLQIGNTIKQYQKDKQSAAASSLMVWLFTFRSVSQPEMRIYGKQLWRELNRGIVHINENMSILDSYYAVAMDITGYHQIPFGMNWSDSLSK